MKPSIVLTLVATVILGICSARAQEAVSPAPPGNLEGVDHPWDHGNLVDLSWNLSPSGLGFLQVAWFSALEQHVL